MSNQSDLEHEMARIARNRRIAMDASPRSEGQEARRLNKPKSANPYSRGTREYDQWKDGWEQIDAL